MNDILIGVVVLMIIGYAVFSVLMNNRKFKKELKLNYGKIPVHKQQLNLEMISLHWQQKNKANSVNHAVDDTTWKDLDMDKIYKRINNANSSVGDEVLYSTLRDQEYKPEKLKKLEDTVQYFDAHDDERLRVQYRLARLGKDPYNGLIEFLYHPDDKRLKYYAIYPLLSLAAFLSIASIFFNKTFGILFLCIMLVVNIMVYYKTKYRLESKLNTVRYFSAAMACAKKISKIKTSGLARYTTKISTLYAPLKTIWNISGAIIYKPIADFDIFEYIKIFFMLDFVLYNQMICSINKHTKKCIEIYEIVGYLDMAISIASYRRSLAYFSCPEFTQTNEIEMQCLIHPLIDKPVANSITLKRNILITGSNASGKSTFVKSLAINAILAQTMKTYIVLMQIILMPNILLYYLIIRIW